MKTFKEEVEYCMKCGEINPPDREICDCGGRKFIFGEKGSFRFKDNKIICKCGNNGFKMTFHMNCNPIYNTTYQCTKCGNYIGVQSYVENVGY